MEVSEGNVYSSKPRICRKNVSKIYCRFSHSCVSIRDGHCLADGFHLDSAHVGLNSCYLGVDSIKSLLQVVEPSGETSYLGHSLDACDADPADVDHVEREVYGAVAVCDRARVACRYSRIRRGGRALDDDELLVSAS